MVLSTITWKKSLTIKNKKSRLTIGLTGTH
jgi:hypothetical protein